MRCALLGFLALGLVAEDSVVSVAPVTMDQWYIGELAGQPAISLHQVVMPRETGGRISQVDMEILIRRRLGNRDVALGIQENQRFQEDAEGHLVAFSFDHRESGETALAVGRVVGRQVVGTLSRLGRTTPIQWELKPGQELLGDVAAQERLKPMLGALFTTHSLAFVANQVVIAQTTATYVGRQAESDHWDLLIDVMPVPMKLFLDRGGLMVGMTMTMGPMTLDLKRTSGPVVLSGADLSPAGLVIASGPVPASRGRNRFRLPAEAQVPNDEFQHLRDGVVEVWGAAPAGPLYQRDPFLASEANLELDDPALRAWVLATSGIEGSDGERAERLRLAVRSHIKEKDLSVADGTALQTFRNQRGDCTEHATLLCAALRIAGIPARIDVGVVYAPGFGGWVGHAWTSAYVSGRWIHLDAAYPGIDRCRYIALGRASGNTGGGASSALIGVLAHVLGKRIETLP